MDRVTRLVPVLVGGFIIGVALGMLAGIVFFNDYITTHTEACEDLATWAYLQGNNGFWLRYMKRLAGVL